MKMINKALICGMFLTGTAAFADDTEDFRDFFESRFIGSTSSASRTWDLTYCVLRNPLNNRCMQKGGFEIFGEADGQVTGLDRFRGNGVELRTQEGVWDHPTYVEAWIDVDYAFNYSGSTTGKKQCHPGNFHCGYEWGNLSPQGKIHIEIQSNPGSNFAMNVWYEVKSGHDDKPNTLVKQAMRNLQSKAVSILERWRDKNGIVAKINVYNR